MFSQSESFLHFELEVYECNSEFWDRVIKNYYGLFHLLFEGVKMGKPYGKELECFAGTYQWALNEPIEKICSFISSSENKPLITVGSGGSFTVASMVTLLHENSGIISKSVTPLNLVPLESSIKGSNILILSAGGSNSDILSAFKFAVNLEPAQVMGICLRPQSPLAKLAEKFHYADIIEYEMPIKKDGFLATNSILALLVLFIRAYKEINLKNEPLPNEFIFTNGIYNYLGTFANYLLKKDTWIVLYGGWGLPAAIDAESKFSESALKNIQVSDYRNFAHGRHYWLCKRTETTGIIALITPQERDIAERTLSLVPKGIPILRLSTQISGPVGSLELIIKVLFLVYVAGISEGVDPGKPNVPIFGREMYHLRPSKNSVCYLKSQHVTDQKIRAITLKSNYHSFEEIEDNELDFWNNSFIRFITKLESTTFGAIVFDYDGTICDPRDRYVGLGKNVSKELMRLLENGIIIGIATGRGKSVREDIRKVIPKKYWEQVLIGYYNGSDIAFLDDDMHPDKSKPIDSTLISIKYLLESDQRLHNLVKFEYRPKQISVELVKPHLYNVTKNILLDIINKSRIVGVQVLESSHSIDILAPGISKLKLVDECKKLAKNIRNSETILCIGDKGKWPGNDYELLSTPYSLSVDTVSSDPDSCWNLSKMGQRGVQTALYYMEHLEVLGGIARLKLKIKTNMGD